MAPTPVHPAQTDEHQYWTDPILCEETRARLEHFRSLGWLPPNVKPKTLEGIAVVERYWRKYLSRSCDLVGHMTLDGPESSQIVPEGLELLSFPVRLLVNKPSFIDRFFPLSRSPLRRNTDRIRKFRRYHRSPLYQVADAMKNIEMESLETINPFTLAPWEARMQTDDEAILETSGRTRRVNAGRIQQLGAEWAGWIRGDGRKAKPFA